VACWRPRPALDTVLSDHEVLLVGAVRFLVIIIIVTSRKCNSLRVSLSPLLATLGTLLGTLGGEAGWHHSAATGDHFLAAWDKERPDRLLVGGVLGSVVEELLDGVPDDIVRYPEVQRLLYVALIAPRCLWP
jgi:hypothetical protein